MKTGKKILAALMALVLVAGLMPARVSAAEEVSYAVEGGNIYFNPETGAITACDSTVNSADIPSEIDGVAVTSIGDYAFYRCKSLTSATIPLSVTSIGEHAFYTCKSLTSITIPSSVTSIGEGAFNGCSSLTSITIPSSVTYIGDFAFCYCDSLTSIDVNAKNTAYYADEGVLFNKGKTELIQYPEGKTGPSYTIPSSVTHIGKYAFYRCGSLTSIKIPSSVTSIGDYAFSYCDSLTSLTIPEGVTSIGNYAFDSCGSLTSIAMPSSVTHVGDFAFYYCDSLTSITIPEGVQSIGRYAFYNCESLTSITIPSSMTSIGEDAFNDCTSLTDVYYGGRLPMWREIDIGGYNVALLRATIHSSIAMANTQSVLVDGTPVVFEVYALEDVNGGETNYIKLRDLAYILNGTAAQFEVSWDGAVNIISGQAYTPNGSEMDTSFEGDREYRPTDAVTKVNGVVTEFDAICLEDDDGGEYNYYKLRDLGKALGFDVSWSYEQGISIATDGSAEATESLVTDTYRYERDDDIKFSYRIPQVNLPGTTVQEVNAEIYDKLYGDVKEALDSIAEGSPITIYMLEYDWAVNGDILSLLITGYDRTGGTFNYVYNFLIATGEMADRGDILAYAGFTEEEYTKTAEQAMGSGYLSEYDFDSYTDVGKFAEFHREFLRDTVSEKNIDRAVPFLNEDGELCVASYQYSGIGTDMYARILNLEDFELLPYHEVLESN